MQVFEALDLHNVVALVRAVLLERQILMVSSQLSLLTATAEVAAALIYPFRWCHTAIPVMPKGMVEVCISVMIVLANLGVPVVPLIV